MVAAVRDQVHQQLLAESVDGTPLSHLFGGCGDDEAGVHFELKHTLRGVKEERGRPPDGLRELAYASGGRLDAEEVGDGSWAALRVVADGTDANQARSLIRVLLGLDLELVGKERLRCDSEPAV